MKASKHTHTQEKNQTDTVETKQNKFRVKIEFSSVNKMSPKHQHQHYILIHLYQLKRLWSICKGFFTTKFLVT